MGGMPFHLEKGPVFATLEARYNGDRNELRAFLQRLWEGQELGTHGVLTSKIHDGPAGAVNAAGAGRKESMFKSWFGDDKVTGAEQLKFGLHLLPDANGNLKPHFVSTTGYWSQYYGDVREIVRQTLLRAGEVALGYDRPNPNDPLPVGSRDPQWRVDFFWKCGQPRFEGWVTWRSLPAQPPNQRDTGHVAVIFATPATPDAVLKRPGDGGPEVSTGDHLKWQGMWVTSHSNHKQYRIKPTQPSAIGQWLVPTNAVMFTRGLGVVGTWVPEFGKGGTPDADKPFTPGP